MDLVERLRGELWKPVTGYEGLYEVSNLGRVRSLPRNTTSGKVLSPGITYGYARVGLQKGSSRKNALVHRLVLESFVGTQPNGCEASHLNGNRLDNKLDNLAWESRSLNHSRKKEHGTHQSGDKAPSAKLTWEQVRLIRSLHYKVKQADLATQFGVHRATIQRIHSGEYWNEI